MTEELSAKFSVVEEQYIKCADCGITLGHVILMQTNEKRQASGQKPVFTRFRITGCYKCNGSSFFTKTYGGTVTLGSPADHVQLDQIDCTTDGQVNTFIMQTRKKR